MSLSAFLTAALESAIDTGMAAPEDVLRHATPDLLGVHLPRPVWSRLISVCLGTPRVDARLVVDTVGIGTMCEHVPAAVMWACLADIAQRGLGRGLVAAPPPVAVATASPRATTVPGVPVAAASTPASASIAAAAPAPAPLPVPPAPVPLAPAPAPLAPAPAKDAAPLPPVSGVPDPIADIARVAAAPLDLASLAAERSDNRTDSSRIAARSMEPEPLGDPPPLPRAPGATTRSTQPIAAARRPQASATSTPPGAAAPTGTAKGARTAPPAARRATTATDFEPETDVGEQWKKPGDAVPVDDDQLVDWAQAEETATTGDKYRKH